MPEDDNETDVFEMRSPVDTEQSEDTEYLSEVQESVLGRETYNLTKANYRVREYEFGDMSKLINLEYYSDFDSALETYDSYCNDDAFINRYRKFCTVELSKRVVGYTTDNWEVVMQTLVYPSE